MQLVSKFVFQNRFKKIDSKLFQNRPALFQNCFKILNPNPKFFFEVRSQMKEKIKNFEGFCIELAPAVFAARIRFKVRLKAEVLKFMLVNTC